MRIQEACHQPHFLQPDFGLVATPRFGKTYAPEALQRYAETVKKAAFWDVTFR